MSSSTDITVFIGLGSNLGDSCQLIAAAVEQIKHFPQTRVTGLSPLYRSKPVGPQDQPDFVNGVVRITTQLPPEELLTALQNIEQNLGRIKKRHWGERTIDLDILLYGSECYQSPSLCIPHREMHRRDFVLRPLLDLTPELSMPDGIAAAHYLATCDDNQLTPISAP